MSANFFVKFFYLVTENLKRDETYLFHPFPNLRNYYGKYKTPRAFLSAFVLPAYSE
jgi:hypothetical protein